MPKVINKSEKTIYGTAFKRSKAAVDDISNLLKEQFKTGNIHLENMEAHKLFEEYDTRLLI